MLGRGMKHDALAKPAIIATADTATSNETHSLRQRGQRQVVCKILVSPLVQGNASHVLCL
jgi:hypothetical protein